MTLSHNYYNKFYFFYIGFLIQFINLTAFRQLILLSSQGTLFTPFFFFFAFTGVFIGNRFSSKGWDLSFGKYLLIAIIGFLLLLPYLLFDFFSVYLFQSRYLEMELLWCAVLVFPINFIWGALLKREIHSLQEQSSDYYFFEILGSFIAGIVYTALLFIINSPTIYFIIVLSTAMFFFYFREITVNPKSLFFHLLVIFLTLSIQFKSPLDLYLAPSSNLYEFSLDNTQYYYQNNHLLSHTDYTPENYLWLDLALSHIPGGRKIGFVNFNEPHVIESLGRYHFEKKVLFQIEDPILWKKLKKIIPVDHSAIKFIKQTPQLALNASFSQDLIIQIPDFKDLYSHFFLTNALERLHNDKSFHTLIFYYPRQASYYSQKELEKWSCLYNGLKTNFLFHRIYTDHGLLLVFSNSVKSDGNKRSFETRVKTRLISRNDEYIIPILQSIISSPSSFIAKKIIKQPAASLSIIKPLIDNNEKISRLVRFSLKKRLYFAFPVIFLIIALFFIKTKGPYKKKYHFIILGFLSYCHYLYIINKFSIAYGKPQIYIGIISSLFFWGFSIGYYREFLKNKILHFIVFLTYILSFLLLTKSMFFYFLLIFNWGVIHSVLLKKNYELTPDNDILFSMDFLGTSMGALFSGLFIIFHPNIQSAVILVSLSVLLYFRTKRPAS